MNKGAASRADEIGVSVDAVPSSQSVADAANAASSERAAGLLLFFNRLRRKFMMRLKAMYSFFQIMVNLGFNCNIRFPISFERVLASLKIVNLDVSISMFNE